MRRRLVPSALWLLAVLAFVCGVAFLVADRWNRPLRDGEQALQEGRLDIAVERFAASEAQFDRLPLTKQLMPRAYHASVFNQLWALFRLEDYDALIEKAAGSPQLAPAHFWTACALFEKGKEEEDPPKRVNWLNRAEEEFRLALQLEPADWDTKFNYELTRRLLNELRKQPKTVPRQLMELLRPETKPAKQPIRRVG